MARLTKFPEHCPHGMRPVDSNRPAKYHRGHLDTEWQASLLLPWEPCVTYFRKVERGNKFRFAFDTTATTSVTVEIIDKDWKPVLIITSPATADVVGNLAADSTQFHSYKYKLPDFSGIATDGVYCLLLTVNYDGTNIEQYVGHPFKLQDTHEGTMLIEYTNTTNKGGSWPEQLSLRYAFSVEAYLGRMIPKSVRTVYQDQNENTDQLYAVSYRNWPLYFGHTGEGISDDVYDLLMRIFDLDTVFLNGKQYVRADGGDWTKNSDEHTPLFGTSITVQEADNFEGFQHGDATLQLYESPGYPYAVYNLEIGTSSPQYLIIPSLAAPSLFNGAVIDDGAEETAFVAAINTAASDLELTGTASRAGGKVLYQNGAGENFQYAQARLFTDKFGFQFQSPGAVSRSITITGGQCIVDWGDGTLDRVTYSPLPRTLTHTFPAGIHAYDIRIFGFMEGFSMVGQGNMGNWSGFFPQGMKAFIMDDFGFPSDTFPWSIAGPAQNTLTTLKLTNCNLVSMPGMNSIWFPYLSNINLSSNNFTSNGVSAFMYDMHYNATHGGAGPNLTNGTFSVVNQLTPATLNTLGNTYKNLLKATSPVYLNWTVNN